MYNSEGLRSFTFRKAIARYAKYPFGVIDNTLRYQTKYIQRVF